MYRDRSAFTLLPLLVCLAFPAHSQSEYLSIRPTPDQAFEAVLSLNTGLCIVVQPVESVEVTGSEILIESKPYEMPPCIGTIPPPTYDYERTAYIGELSPGQYTVTWNQAGSFNLSASVTVSGLQGPYVPCVGCNELVHAPFPETGSWYNPDQSGTGLNFEIQNGVLAGYYYGYDLNGLPEWHLFTGPLVRSDKQGVLWELKTQLQRFEEGNCIGCDYVAPTGPAEGSTITLDFMQRAYLRITIGDNPSQFFVPFIYGSAGKKYFEAQTPYVFPEYGGGGSYLGDTTYFMFVTRPNTDPPSPWLWESFILPITAGKVATGGSLEGKLYYETFTPQGPPGPDVLSVLIVCELDQASGEPGCKWVAGPKKYTIPVGNLTDSRIYGEAEDGSTIEGYRINYD